jgi:hypothetical protein
MQFSKWLPTFQRVKVVDSFESLVPIYQTAWHHSSANRSLLICHATAQVVNRPRSIPIVLYRVS